MISGWRYLCQFELPCEPLRMRRELSIAETVNSDPRYNLSRSFGRGHAACTDQRRVIIMASPSEGSRRKPSLLASNCRAGGARAAPCALSVPPEMLLRSPPPPPPPLLLLSLPLLRLHCADDLQSSASMLMPSWVIFSTAPNAECCYFLLSAAPVPLVRRG